MHVSDRKARSSVHAAAGMFGLILISLFFSSSLIVELFGDEGQVAAVKHWILIGVIVLIPTMVILGGSGRSLLGKRPTVNSGRSTVIRIKQRRMAVIAAIGLLVLTPCAVILKQLSAAGHFGTIFSAVQALELLGGAVNITLMGLNVRAGRRLAGKAERQQVGKVGVR